MGFICDCKFGFSGHQCNTKDFMHPKFCGPGQFEIYGNDVKCICPLGFQGAHCEQPFCISKDSNGVVRNLCQNGGRCIIGMKKCYCACNVNFEGDFCQFKKKKSCGNGVQAFDANGQSICLCDEGYSGSMCINPAVHSSVCFHGKISRSVSGEIECYCPIGWGGKLCDKSICQSNDEKSLCAYGLCRADKGEESYCQCTQWSEGEFCSLARCDKKGFCENGLCLKDNEIAYCHCFSGWEGERCNVPSCQNPQNCINGECKVFEGMPTCVCFKGFTGPRCETATPEGYQNCGSGECVITPENVHSCKCNVKTHTGHHCQFKCLVPCDHGECKFIDGAAVCLCEAGYIGNTCTEKIK